MQSSTMHSQLGRSGVKLELLGMSGLENINYGATNSESVFTSPGVG